MKYSVKDKKTIKELFSKSNKEVDDVYGQYYDEIVTGEKYERKNPISFERSNILYENCDFLNLDFSNLKFDNVFFVNCRFTSCNFIESKITYGSMLVFSECKIYRTKFDHCDLAESWFLNCFMLIVQLIDINLSHSVFAYCGFKNVVLTGKCNISGSRIFKSNTWFSLGFTDHRSIICDEQTEVDGFDYTVKRKDFMHNYVFSRTGKVDVSESVAETYNNFATLFKYNNYPSKFGELFYSSKLELHKSLKGFEKLKSFVKLITCGYGEKPQYGIYSALVYIILNSFIYMSGIKWNGELIRYNWSFSSEGYSLTSDKIVDFMKCAYFSVTTYTTVGYGDSIPVGLLSRFTSVTEMLFGVVLTTVVTGSLLRKMFR